MYCKKMSYILINNKLVRIRVQRYGMGILVKKVRTNKRG